MKWTTEDSLRAAAEQTLRLAERAPDDGQSRDALLYELSVHQAELEMQNEALRDAQLDLASSELRYRELFDNAPVGYLVVGSGGRIELANHAAAEALGKPVASVVGSLLASHVLPEEAIGFERYRRAIQRSPARLTAEFRVKSVQGRHREVRMEGLRSLEDDGRWRVAMSDVTAYNEILRRNVQADRLQAIGRQTGNVAHDLNHLLVSILEYADLALGALNPRHVAFDPLLRLREMGNRCAVATAQLASFSRADPAEPPIVSLNVVLQRLEPVLRSALGTDVALVYSITATDPDVRLHPAQIEQVALNALRNAQQAMPAGGTFRVETSTVEIEPTNDREAALRYVRWKLTDTGTGMSEEIRRNAFEPFFTTRAAGAGAGLGLSLIRAIVERAGGSVRVESEVGAGTSVVVHLPCASG
ncbi:MAG TPA: ATP-binding protein [Polyangiaceae bacterium]|nr:ATP-binding protein [Polyangiaceae bacterium]